MTEGERANWLARAVDDIVRGANGPKSSESPDGENEPLLKPGDLRADGGQAGRKARANHDSAALEALLDHLETQQDLGASASEAAFAADAIDDGEMAQLIAFRHDLSVEALSIAEKHREDVWQRVQERISRADAPPCNSAPQTLPFTSGDAELDSLVRAALSQTPVTRDPAMQARLWARVGVDQSVRLHDALSAMSSDAVLPRFTPRVAGVLAAASLLIGLLAPLPYTGWDAHPVTSAADYVGQQIGVLEDTAPPTGVTTGGVAAPQE